MLRAIFAATCVVLGFSQNSVSVSSCGGSDAAFAIQSLTFNPITPIVGQPGTLTSIYDVPIAVTGGKAHYTCTLNGLPVMDETYDLCTQTSCPIGVGTHSDKSASDVPNVNGKVACTIQWNDMAGAPLMCIKTAFKITTTLQLRRPWAFVMRPMQGFIFSKALVAAVPIEQKALMIYSQEPFNHFNGTCPQML
jgi:hypothetical protein